MGTGNLPTTLALLLVLLSGCAPAPQPQRSSEPATQQQPRERKVLTLAGQEGNIADFPGVAGGSTAGSGGFVHDYLVKRDARDAWVPELAAALPSVDEGTWRINPDGTMDIVWKLRPNVKWHDGTSFTSADLLFTFNAFKDPELPSRYGGALRLMESASALDPVTFLVHWSRPFATAIEAPALNPMAQHLLGDVYLNDRANFGNSRFFSTEFVGLGAYKLVRWEQGSHMEFTRFDEYYRGRSPFDGVVVRFIDDSNAMIAAILAGAITVAHGSIDVETALEVRRRWEGTGNQVLFGVVADVAELEMQYRPEFARPRNGLTNRDVREALYRAIDRDALVEAATHRTSPVADSWIRPDDPRYLQLEAAIPKYPYDPARAQERLAQAGWLRGGDGTLVYNQTGERFEVELWNQDRDKERTQNILADYWKAVGVQSTPMMFPSPRNRELETTRSGPLLTSPKGYDVPYNSRLDSKNISSAANRWSGRNRAGYHNPQVDEVLDKLAVTIDPRETMALHRQLLQEALGDLSLLPLYFDVNPILMLKGVRGPGHGTYVHWNFFEWDKE